MAQDQLMEIKSKFEGNWKQYKSENFEAFMREVGTNYILSKLAGLTNPRSDIKVDNDQISITLNSALLNRTNTFRLGEALDNEVQGEKYKITLTYEDGKLVSDVRPVSAKLKPHTVTREKVGDQMLTTMCAGDVVCKVYFRRV